MANDYTKESTTGTVVTGPLQILHLAISGTFATLPGLDKWRHDYRWLLAIPRRSSFTLQVREVIRRFVVIKFSQLGSPSCHLSVRTDDGGSSRMTLC